MLEIVYERDVSYRVRVIGGEYLLIGNNKSRALNISGYMFWQLIDGIKSVRQIVSELAKNYNRSFQEIELAIKDFVEELESLGIIYKTCESNMLTR